MPLQTQTRHILFNFLNLERMNDVIIKMNSLVSRSINYCNSTTLFTGPKALQNFYVEE